MKLFPHLTTDLSSWAQRQPVFFTGSAGKHAAHINVSPKGMTDTHFAILTPNRCAYIDRTGSGCETISHAYENGRLCIMFMSLGDTPRIMRLFCRARVVEYNDAEFAPLVRAIAKGKRDAFDGARAVIVADIWEVQTSCGYGVPRVKRGLYVAGDERPEELLQKGFNGEGVGEKGRLDELCVFEARPTMDVMLAKKADGNGIREYQTLNNRDSIDGLPGLRVCRRDAGEVLWLGDLRAWVRRVARDWEALVVGFGMAVLVFLLGRVMGVV
ncbi:pyridoxamine phosphate oxidase family protein [Pochonia chlamydosporia 170]|uniref:Pyridoxamine phosphate oxidase family protein n=1 Tax=Pochonia chlamydosporia 170 TaxID=1380566 RepID=A0A179F6D4_METCM|nr:pyridoxamine phosphate oxidase family protein [Pochonia chlamydosporia 170]OAQ61004.1 pyridoxamine phosphate oxidase family protein [Pochonia chlamydosporia 170]